jgi:raffinose/stachyose/melibiose transport system permease protein
MRGSPGITDKRHHGPWTPWLYLLPALLIYAVFVLAPVAESFRLSFFEWPTSFSDPVFVGLGNFAKLLHDPIFWRALFHNGLLLILSLCIQLPVALGLAVLLSYPIRGRWLFRTIFFAPMVMPTVAIAVLWSYVFMPESGLVDQVIRLMDSGFGHGWLGGQYTALPCVFIVICWRYVGFHMVLFMAGLAAVPDELYEAARIDGASEWQAFRYITLPLIKPALAVSATLSIIGSLKYFDLVYMMIGGAPEMSRELLATYVYRLAFDSGQGRYGYGSAVAVMLFIIALAIASGVTWWSRGRARA